MNNKLAKVIEQIKKLLALGQSSNEHESALAIFKAKELMLKYNIEEIDIQKETVKDIIEIDFDYANSQDQYVEKFSYWIGKAFNLKPIKILTNTSKTNVNLIKSIRFIGRKTDVIVGTFVFGYILEILDKKSKEYSSKSENKKTYCIGFIEAVCEKLQKMEENRTAGQTYYDTHSETALVVATNALIENFVKENYKNLNNAKDTINKQNNTNDFCNGYVEGEKQQISNGIENKFKNKLT